MMRVFDMPMFSRRNVLKSLPVVGLAAAVPTAALAEVESVTDRIDRLTAELSESLGQYLTGDFIAVVGADDVDLHRRASIRILPAVRNAEERLEFAKSEAASAFEELHPGWRVQMHDQVVRGVKVKDGVEVRTDPLRHALLVYASSEPYGPETAGWFVKEF